VKGKLIAVSLCAMLILSMSLVSAERRFYPTRDINVSDMLPGEEFYICNNQVLHASFFNISLRYVTDHGGEGRHFIVMTEKSMEMLYCSDGKTVCGQVEKATTYEPKQVIEGLIINVKDTSSALLYVFTVTDEYRGYIVLKLTEIKGYIPGD
jgi:hypothetical protein